MQNAACLVEAKLEKGADSFALSKALGLDFQFCTWTDVAEREFVALDGVSFMEQTSECSGSKLGPPIVFLSQSFSDSATIIDRCSAGRRGTIETRDDPGVYCFRAEDKRVTEDDLLSFPGVFHRSYGVPVETFSVADSQLTIQLSKDKDIWTEDLGTLIVAIARNEGFALVRQDCR